MKNNSIDFSGDFIGHSKSKVESYVPSIGDHSQKRIPRTTLIPEDSILSIFGFSDLEAPQKTRDAREIGYIPGVTATNRNVIAQKMEEGFKTGKMGDITKAFNYHKIPDIEEITVAPSEFGTAIHQEYDPVEIALIRNILRGNVKQYTIPTAVTIATNFSKFALQACIAAAHEVRNLKLVGALHPLQREKLTNLPKVEQKRLKLR